MSLPAELTSHLSTRLALEFAERDMPYSAELNKTVALHTQRGTLTSSMMATHVLDQGRIELKARAQLLLSHFFRTAGIFGLVYENGIAAEANRFLQELLAMQRTHVRAVAEDYAKKSGFSPGFSHFDEAAEREARRLESELHLWETQIKQRKEGSAPTSNVVNVAGNFNIVQTGTFGSSIVIDADSRQTLLQGLGALRGALPGAGELDTVQKTELEQVIDDCEHEVTKEKPNRSRLLGSLQALATMIQTTASLQPAWQMIQRAMQLMGISF
jgi:hypothetical protein